MKFIDAMIKRFIKKDIKVLGRWNIEYCDNKINNKIDSSNQDHCGPCGKYVLYDSVKNINKSKISEFK
jgi:hypothetical protein